MKFNFVKITLLMSIILTSACERETIDLDKMPDPDRDYGISIPLAQAHFTMGAFIEKVDTDNYLSIEEDGLIVRKYNKDFVMEMENMVKLNDVNYSTNLPYINVGESASVNQTIKTKYPLNDRKDARYDRVKLGSGLLIIENLNCPAGTTGSIRFEIPEMSDADGNVLSKSVDVNSFSPESINLQDYEIHFSSGIDSSYVTLITQINIDVPSTSPSGEIGVDFGINNLIASETFGYFGQFSKTIVDSVEFDVFDADAVLDAVQMANVYIDINTSNPVGCPFDIVLDSVALSDKGSDHLMLELNNNVFNIEAATYADPVNAAWQIFHIDKSNSNILAIIDKLPNRIATKMIAISNPRSNPETTSNFIQDNSQLKASFDITFPLHFKASDYERKDTIDLDFNDVFESSEVTDAIDLIQVYMDVYNGLPFDINLESVMAVDANYNMIEELLDEPGKIASAKPDEDGHVNETVHSEITITIDGVQINKLRQQQMKYLILRTKGYSYGASNDEYIKIFEDNVIDITLSAEVKGNIPDDL